MAYLLCPFEESDYCYWERGHPARPTEDDAAQMHVIYEKIFALRAQVRARAPRAPSKTDLGGRIEPSRSFPNGDGTGKFSFLFSEALGDSIPLTAFS